MQVRSPVILLATIPWLAASIAPLSAQSVETSRTSTQTQELADAIEALRRLHPTTPTGVSVRKALLERARTLDAPTDAQELLVSTFDADTLETAIAGLYVEHLTAPAIESAAGFHGSEAGKLWRTTLARSIETVQRDIEREMAEWLARITETAEDAAEREDSRDGDQPEEERAGKETEPASTTTVPALTALEQRVHTLVSLTNAAAVAATTAAVHLERLHANGGLDDTQLERATAWFSVERFERSLTEALAKELTNEQLTVILTWAEDDDAKAYHRGLLRIVPAAARLALDESERVWERVLGS